MLLSLGMVKVIMMSFLESISLIISQSSHFNDHEVQEFILHNHFPIHSLVYLWCSARAHTDPQHGSVTLGPLDDPTRYLVIIPA